MEKKNLRRLRLLVTAQTAWHLEELRKICGYREIGHVIDKLVREKLLSLRSGRGGTKECKFEWSGPKEK